jgi:hypothetical protein
MVPCLGVEEEAVEVVEEAEVVEQEDQELLQEQVVVMEYHDVYHPAGHMNTVV